MKLLEYFYIWCLICSIVQGLTNDNDDKSCESKFCEEDPNYPEKILNTLELWRHNIDSSLDLKVKRSLDRTTFLAEKKLCDTRTSFMRPQKLENISGRVRTIVNHLNYSQIVKFETCSSENFPCTFNVFPQSVKSYCQQKHSTLKLLAYDEDHNCIVTEKFQIPSSCDCQIDKEDLLRGVKKDCL